MTAALGYDAQYLCNFTSQTCVFKRFSFCLFKALAAQEGGVKAEVLNISSSASFFI